MTSATADALQIPRLCTKEETFDALQDGSCSFAVAISDREADARSGLQQRTTAGGLRDHPVLNSVCLTNSVRLVSFGKYEGGIHGRAGRRAATNYR
jgi:hypothetical protein